MQLRSLAGWTESWFVEEVRDLGDAVALRCPTEPTFRWGNVLMIPDAPEPGDRACLEARFAEVFDDLPEVRHVTVGWDDPEGREGDVAEWQAAGYEIDRNVTRVAEAADLHAPAGRPAGFAVRAARDDDDWRQVVALQASDPGDEEPTSYRALILGRAAFRRRLAEGVRPDLHGAWFLATLHGVPVGSMGLFVHQRVGRFQFVHVAPEHRRKGVATAMVHAVAREGLGRMGAERLVIVGDEGTSADGIYAALGFRAVERLVGACRKEPVGAERQSVAPGITSKTG
ncbi:MAG: GNAT family N-acetyltransferase [Trueperaceae bacterium]|nr:GNAT family N-acetyltransferase [Trueperaceae bacterium]